MYVTVHTIHRRLTFQGFEVYSVYGTKDGKFITVGALEPRFYAIFL